MAAVVLDLGNMFVKFCHEKDTTQWRRALADRALADRALADDFGFV